MPLDQLKIKALVVLEEAQASCGRVQVERSLALRFAIAFLYAVGEADREAFDAFWRETTDCPLEPDPTVNGRSQTSNALLNAIYRAVGVVRTPALIQVGAEAAIARRKLR